MEEVTYLLESAGEIKKKLRSNEEAVETDARLLVVGTRYYQDSAMSLHAFLQQVRGTYLTIRPDRDCKQDPHAVAVCQTTKHSSHKVGHIAKELTPIAREVIRHCGGKEARIYVEGAESGHTSLVAWPVLSDGGVVKTITKLITHIKFPCGDIGAIWPCKVTDTALVFAKFTASHYPQYLQREICYALSVAALSNPEAFSKAARYLCDTLRIKGDMTNYTVVQNLTMTADAKELPADEAKAPATDLQEKAVSDGAGDDNEAAADDGMDDEQRRVKAAVEAAVNDVHFKGGKDWGLVRYSLESVGKEFSSYNTFLDYVRSLGFDNLPGASTISRGYSPIHGNESRGYSFSDNGDTVEAIRRTNIIKMIAGYYNRNLHNQ